MTIDSDKGGSKEVSVEKERVHSKKTDKRSGRAGKKAEDRSSNKEEGLSSSEGSPNNSTINSLSNYISGIFTNVDNATSANSNNKIENVASDTSIKTTSTISSTNSTTTDLSSIDKKVSLISTLEFDTLFREYVYCGKSSEVILAITEDNKLMRTEDKGLNWTLVELPEDPNHRKSADNFMVFKIKVSPSEPDTVVVLGYKGFSWISNNRGEKFATFLFPILDYIFHPYEKDWGLGLTNGENRNQNLLLTQDKGATWKLIAQNIVQVGWGCLKQEEDSKVPKQRILMTFYPRSSLSKYSTANWFLGWTYKVDFVYSDDFFESTIVAVQKGNKFVLTPKYLFVAILIDEETQEIGLVVSSSKEQRYLFNEIMINIKTLSSRSYIFLDTAENSVFVHFNQFGTYSTFGNIYNSGGFGERFGLSLEYNVRNKENQCDFETIQGLEGIYIANVIDKQYLESNFGDIRNEMISMQDNVSQEDYKQGNYYSSQGWILKSLDKKIQTKITFNKGGSWHRLIPPTKGVNDRTIDCFKHTGKSNTNSNNPIENNENILNNEEAQQNDCFLNLHGVSSSFPLVYSVKSAVGLIIANGNIGRYLTNEKEHVNTYISRDGGFNWKEILQGPHIYEIGNRGAAIIFCEYNKYVDYFLYTLDEGNTFEKVFFDNNMEIKVINIITSNDNKSQQFLIFGKTRTGGTTVHIDIGKLNLPACKESSTLFSNNIDFEKWVPSGAFNLFNPCLMGTKTEYYRKKQTSQCSVSLTFESKVDSHVCTCKAEDYECDIGYIRKGINCVKESMDYNLERDLFSPPLECKDTYRVTKGYRKVPGNQCKGEEVSEFEPIIMYCPNNIFSASGQVLLGVGIIGFTLLFVLAFSKSALSCFKRSCYGMRNALFGAPLSCSKKYDDCDRTTEGASLEQSYCESDNKNNTNIHNRVILG
eukprot:CAMPEP_0170536632 /NCGR_PEP_ID=MMETSP0209-20121228/102255_1 /TAXON_ID=665100 ORGANISM="Litonotus pictus, Strain P1" /NCGR_SAMPLE_ID=MMETSP0209 /ASSEMBLY_ACC=CAM_ASM_000301 /LENGTH=929 /DNA_ID=CAMNT_0010838013 /DNA_START=135 /DNA_END=2920 /DNA_ORIENTATION=+